MTAEKHRRPHVHASAGRYDRVDALRGAALVWMALFHFCFDLANFRLIEANFYQDPFWTWQRTAILSTFLLCAGAGQAIATHRGQTWRRFWLRWAQIVGCALLVSLGSWWMFPLSYISFGVLHGMAVMLIIARLSAPLGRWLWPLGVVAILLPQLVQHPLFDTRWTNWVGLVTRKPITEDFVPILPWLGVMWWGLAGTQWLLARQPTLLGSPASQITPSSQRGDNTGSVVWRGLTTLGQWSLTFYMVHQPVFIGGLTAWLYLTRPQG
ncbi:DUF1624 domain-containing protein [Aquabacterium fontiphilum]|jgi:uncharacterized membrane protein|uniref:DUF1624 domain-containing protein n=1 Tax=Aquabacterium fontiphilum TaxID=450365 RepID=UPI001378F208|nr:heparan-alpha-glucosaminide N-acetyltransferase [Aquabacterium fontiphilum]NBD21931.1 DUF1624 domain-containing protein [Aquabacterium fontiphilum]